MFITALQLQDLEDGNNWKLLQELIWDDSENPLVIVPAGQKTDLASIPRAIRSFYPKTGKYNRAAVLHDFLYRNFYYQYGERVTKEFADRLSYTAMIASGVRKSKAIAFYRGVKLFGGSSWRAGYLVKVKRERSKQVDEGFQHRV